MKKLKIQKYLLLLLAGFLMTSCFSEDNFLTDNLEETGRSFPNITDVDILTDQQEYSEGDIIQLDVRFWSEDPVQEIVLYDRFSDSGGNEIKAEEEALASPASNASFSEESQTDFLILDYEVPAITEDPTIITFVVEVVNENGLSERNTEAKNPTIRTIEVVAIP